MLERQTNGQLRRLHVSRETEARGSGAACSQGWKTDERSAQTPTREQRGRGQRQWGGRVHRAGKQTSGQLRTLREQRQEAKRQWGSVFTRAGRLAERSAQTPTHEQRDRGQRQWAACSQGWKADEWSAQNSTQNTLFTNKRKRKAFQTRK